MRQSAGESPTATGEALEHGCAGVTGEVVYAAGPRLKLPALSVGRIVASSHADRSAVELWPTEGPVSAGPPCRAALNVYRI